MASDLMILRARRDDVARAIMDGYREYVKATQQNRRTMSLDDVILGRLDVLIAEQADMDGKPRLHRGASEAQQMTVAELADTISDKRITMLRHVGRHANGITCDLLELMYGLPHSSASARLNWLERQGLVARDHDRKVKTRAGGTANPYEITDAGRQVLRRSHREQMEVRVHKTGFITEACRQEQHRHCDGVTKDMAVSGPQDCVCVCHGEDGR